MRGMNRRSFVLEMCFVVPSVAQAEYTGVFSDIRYDEHYESFYNNFPDKDKLPPPLDSSVLASLQKADVCLRRTESDASVDDLIFREARKMRPRSSNNLLRDDSISSLSSLTRNMSCASVDEFAGKDRSELDSRGAYAGPDASKLDANASPLVTPSWASIGGLSSQSETSSRLQDIGKFNAVDFPSMSHTLPERSSRFHVGALRPSSNSLYGPPPVPGARNASSVAREPRNGSRLAMHGHDLFPKSSGAASCYYSGKRMNGEEHLQGLENPDAYSAGECSRNFRELGALKFCSFADVRGKIESLAKDQYGCRCDSRSPSSTSTDTD